MNKTSLRIVLAAIALAALGACAHREAHHDGRLTATATLTPTTGNSTTGSVRFAQSGETVRVVGEISGLRPGAEHGFHVHERGDCSSGDGMSTGGHFNPGGAPHGRHGAGTHHVGDMPSLRANANGVARFDFTSTSIRLGNGPNSVVGKGLIVHRDPDDYTTQPTGNAGPRLACAVITRS